MGSPISPALAVIVCAYYENKIFKAVNDWGWANTNRYIPHFHHTPDPGYFTPDPGNTREMGRARFNIADSHQREPWESPPSSGGSMDVL